jgi:hypothetical protein
MHVESSAQTIKTHIAMVLIAFQMNTPSGDEFVLDVIEYIARRMRDHNDKQVAKLGIFVRINMMSFKSGRLTFQQTLTRLAMAALRAPLGECELDEVLEIGFPRR